MDRKLLGRRIREERIRIGLTQEQIAEKIGLTEPRTKIVVYKPKNAYGGNEKWLNLQKGTGNYTGRKLVDGRNIIWRS